MKMQKFYDEATDHLGILIKHAEEEQDKLAAARKAFNVEADSVRTEIIMVRDALGESTGYYGRGPIYPPHLHKKRQNPYAQLPPEEKIPEKPEIFTPEVRAKMKERLAALEEQQDKINVEEQENYKAFAALAGAIEDLSKARAFLTAPATMFIRFYEGQNPDSNF